MRISGLKDKELEKLSQKMLLSLNLEEMRTVQEYFRKKKRNPTAMEIEVIAQTWSEHCKHKTMMGIIEYREQRAESRERREIINNLLKETIFKATKELKKNYCLSVFEDNAGVIEWNKDYGIAMKVETHNHPSAIEPYGGAATGIGGVIRDILGCGKGARPVLNIDVFCLGMLKFPYNKLQPGILHPRRIFKGVVQGVRDYGNRMGIPTSSGAIVFDPDYLYNPLVYCGTLGIMEKKFIRKKVKSGDLIVAIGGRTGRDGIHGATFSSIGMDENPELSCVQIGDPITEKKFTDVLLKARNLQLYNAITDCGAGGFSSAIGELGEKTGARVYLERAPLKYRGLKPWEVFLSESQERMVLSVPRTRFKHLKELLEKEDVEASVLGEFTSTGRLEVLYKGKKEADIDMGFLHKGVPRIKRKAVWIEKSNGPLSWVSRAEGALQGNEKFLPAKGYAFRRWEAGKIKDKELKVLLRKIISHPNIASKEVVIRQYDHEVQGSSVLKPLSGAVETGQDAPQDGCVIRPLLDSFSGIAVGLGINPSYGRIDPFGMALSNCEEAARNLVACGGDINKAAFLDNFCWGDTSEEKILGGLVRAAKGCYQASMMLKIPFVSGKDSLNNFYLLKGKSGTIKINIPGTLLITCVAPVKDIRKVIGSDFKKQGNFVYLVGHTYPEAGGSLLYEHLKVKGGKVPGLCPDISLKTLRKINRAIEMKILSACHDLSEGGLAVAVTEMCFSGSGCEIDLSRFCMQGRNDKESAAVKLFSESNSRFLVEVEKSKKAKFERLMAGLPVFRIGRVLKEEYLHIKSGRKTLIIEKVQGLKKIWKGALKW